jgi:hypothetical protein
MAQPIEPIVEVIEKLGGVVKFGAFFGVSKSVANVWRTRGFPADLFVAMSRRFLEAGIQLPPELWGQRELPDRIDAGSGVNSPAKERANGKRRKKRSGEDRPQL